MKRQKIQQSDMKYKEFHNSDEDIPMYKVQPPQQKRTKTIEAQILENDTLQAIALRYNCSVAELKRLNKIDKENEIFARKILLIPYNLHTVLVSTGELENENNQSSSKIIQQNYPVLRNQKLESKTSTSSDKSINEIILNTKLKPNRYTDVQNTDTSNVDKDNPEPDENTPFTEISDNTDFLEPHPVVLRHPNDLFSFSGADCDISWICLLFGILALCVAIPLIYIVYIAENPDKFHHNESD